MEERQIQIYEFGDFRLDASKRQLTGGDGQPIALTPKVFDTLLYLVRHRGKVIGKDELMREIWSDSVVEENNLNQNISTLRRVFGEKPGEHRFIVTVAGHGYRFVPEVTEYPDQGSGETVLPEANDIAAQRSEMKPRSKMAAVGVLGALAIGAIGFYFWLANQPSADATIKTIAILPFKPLVAENRNEALELGLADTLISKLSGNEQIAVRPLSAIRRFTSVDQDSLAAGRQLGVESVLDGTIQTWGDRIRISAKLLRTNDGMQLWAGQYDEKSTDIFTVQDAISERVAAALKIRLTEKRKKHSTENIEAHQLYMRGRFHIAKLTPPDLLASIPYFEQALELDPGYALAYTGLSQAYGVLGITGEMATSEAFPKARAAEEKAMQIDDGLGEAHISLCMGKFWYDWDWRGAESSCLRALEIDPNNADFHAYFAQVLSSTGRHDEALAHAKRARELNPVNLGQSAIEGQQLLYAGRVDEALAQLRKTSELEPRFWMPYLIATSAYIEKGMYDQAIAEWRKEVELAGGRSSFPFGIYALAKSGRTEEAQVELDKLLASSQTKNVSPYNIALIYNGLGDLKNSVDWLERGYLERDPKMTFLKVEPKWNGMRQETRFKDLMRRMNFPL